MSYGDGDREWINHRLSEYSRCHTIEHLQAAIARGYERGKAESRDIEDRLDAELTRVRNALTRFGVPDTAGETPHHRAIQPAERVDMLGDDRDRLAKRCEELEWQAQKAPIRERSDRLAALEQRVGALVEIVERYLGDEISGDEAAPMLAALRAPGVGTGSVAAIVDALVTDQGALDALTRERDALRRAVGEANAERDAARRERDEAAGVLRAMIQWQADMEREEEPVLFDSIIARARALVARGAGPSKLDAIMTEREAEIIGESFAAERELRAEIATLRISLAEAQGEVATERSKRIAAEHATGDTEEVLLRVERDRDALRTRLDAAGRLIERAGAFAYQVVDFINGAPISLSLQQSRALLADLRAWGK